MDEKTKRELHQQALTTNSIRQEFEQTLPERVERYLQVKPHIIIPNAPFAIPSSECSFLYRDGHFYACIALVQAVAEAIVRYICDLDFGRHGKVFEKNVEKLYERKFISDKLRESLLKIWEKRDDYHHLNSNVKSDRQSLEKLAKEKACLLVEVESEIFKFSFGNDGSIIPKYPKYWKISGNQMEVFLRLKP
ncbi:hypothetical protein ES703_47848 [subsurface metagenome]